ncbi:hypothetical protein Bsp3421_004426 [Burkholderia sp. FERM BP-3421]|uniref:hypothetical protein n=1 Tax=Burkholderia sp. FERM BP-3421 TaxID=1494466 RepID=UPI00235F106A|nr:hypothetical protein [Burkholderia sp. FERM BP-3421]WDD94308.1 hypothetical protein Bsp3421_004426 [Burkholderia sp. FERM BP-3421]
MAHRKTVTQAAVQPWIGEMGVMPKLVSILSGAPETRCPSIGCRIEAGEAEPGARSASIVRMPRAKAKSLDFESKSRLSHETGCGDRI